MNFGSLVALAIGAIFINNFVLARFLGLCPFMGVSKKTETAIGMGMAVIFVMTMSSAITWIIWTYFLLPTQANVLYNLFHAFGANVVPAQFDFAYLETIAFILVIATFVQLTEMIIQKSAPALYEALGIFLPLITTNCAVLGVAELNTMSMHLNFLESLVHGISAGIGFTIALLLMSGIRERLEIAEVPRPMKGLPIAFIVAAIMSIAFLGFSGLKF
ncbi:electron transport complex subunit RsxA [bacterium]|nr:MAG: electron transport complex subunit RsxA [bacterium]